MYKNNSNILPALLMRSKTVVSNIQTHLWHNHRHFGFNSYIEYIKKRNSSDTVPYLIKSHKYFKIIWEKR